MAQSEHEHEPDHGLANGQGNEPVNDEFHKKDLKHEEEFASSEAKGAKDVIVRPESIRGMTDAELQKLETRMVRKLDFVIM